MATAMGGKRDEEEALAVLKQKSLSLDSYSSEH